MSSRSQRDDDLNERVSMFGLGWLHEHGPDYFSEEDRLDALFFAVERAFGTLWARSFCLGLDVRAHGREVQS